MPALPTVVLPRLRPELVALAERLVAVRLTTVVAPAGSGKSTLLHTWRVQSARVGLSTAFFNLSPVHDDVGLFVYDLIEVVKREVPLTTQPFGEPTLRVLANVPVLEQSWRVVLRSLVRELSSCLVDPLLLFLDNYHVLDASSLTHQLASELIRSAPPALFVVVASRGALPSVASRLRIEGAALDIGLADLRLTEDEVERLVHDAGLPVAPGLAGAIRDRTDGWVTGVLLAVRSLARLPSTDHKGFLESLSRQPDLFGYVAGEMITRESAPLIGLLEAVALLGRCSVSTVSRFLGGTSAATLVEEALNKGLLSRQADELEIHPLWSELLRNQVRDRLNPAEWSGLQVRVGDVLSTSDRVEDALAAYDAGADWSRVAALLVERGIDLIERGQIGAVRSWIARLPEDIVSGDPELLFLRGQSLSRIAPDQAFDSFERAVIRFAARGNADRELKVLIELALLAYSQNRRDKLTWAVRRILTFRSLVSRPAARGTALTAVAGLCFTQGRLLAAARLARQAQRFPLGVMELWASTAILATAAFYRGDLEDGLRLVNRALSDPELRRNGPASLSLINLRGYLRGRLGDPAGGLVDCRAALEAFRDFGLVRHRAIAAQAGALLTGMLGELQQSSALAEEAIRLNVEVGDERNETWVRIELAANAYRRGDHQRARQEAQTVLRAFDRGLVTGATHHWWWFATACWILGQTGSPVEAWDRAKRHRRRLAHPGFPLVHHTILLTLADLARIAGDSDQARELALVGWRFAARSNLQAIDPGIGEFVSRSTAPEALRAGMAVDYVFERLLAIGPDCVLQVLISIADDPDSAVRLRSIQLIERLGGAEAFERLRSAGSDPDSTVRSAARAAAGRLAIEPAHRIRVESFSGLRMRRGDHEVTEDEWHGLQERRLLARLLIARGRPLTRERLIDDLWSETDLAAGQNRLRVALSWLNGILEPDRPAGVTPRFVVVRGPLVALDRTAGIDWDVDKWLDTTNALARTEQTPDPQTLLDRLDQHITDYPGTVFPDLPDQRWLEPLREEVRQAYRQAAGRLASLAFELGDLPRAIRVAERLLTLDPCDEESCLTLMQAYLRLGNRPAARRTYRRLEAALRAELDLAPADTLQALLREMNDPV